MTIKVEHIATQSQPQEGDKIVLDHVLSDLIQRAYFGKEKYGTMLKTNNGRDALVDAYQEALDLVMYLKQTLLEREEMKEKQAQLWNDGTYIVEIVNGAWHTKVKGDSQ